MPTDESGDKWACEPCIRGHRSTRCEHYDRFMLRVKKPGRPLSSCPHPKNQCTCGKERVMMVRIPKASSCICAPAYTLGPDGLPLMSLQATPPPGYQNSSPTYLFQTPGLNGTYRIQKPNQRYESSVDSQAIARAIHAKQWVEQPVYGSGEHVAPYAGGSQYQLQHHNVDGVRHSGLSSQGDVSLSLREPPSSLQAERSLHHEQIAGAHGNRLVTGRKEGSYDISSGLSPKDQQNGSASLEQPPLSQSFAASKRSLDDPDLLSHEICCHGKPHVQITKSEGSNPLVLDNNGQPEYTVLAKAAAISQSAVSMQDEVLNGTISVSDHAKHQESTPLGDRPPNHGNEQTTFYAIPSTFATTSHPLHPAQSNFVYRHSQLYSQKVPQHVPYGSNESTAPLTEGNVAFTPAHNCNCGDTCDCLGCAAHPYNATTRNHVQSLGDLLALGDDEQQPGSPPQPPYDIPFLQATDVHSMAPGINPRLAENVPSPPVSSHYGVSILPLAENEVTSLVDTYNEAHMQVFSSSGYYTMEFPMESLSGCTDVSGSCQCGDDCACIGCLTHTGHNGISLDLDSAVVPASPNGIESRQDDLHEDDERGVSAPKECCI